jgi:hypothetical protein
MDWLAALTWDILTPNRLSENLTWDALNAYERVEDYVASGRLEIHQNNLVYRGEPTLPNIETADGHHYYERGEHIARALGYTVKLVEYGFTPVPPEWDAYTLGMHMSWSKTILIKLQGWGQMARVMFHEVAHALSGEVLHAYEALEYVPSRSMMINVCETIAEGAAMLALGVLGFDTRPASVPYLASYGLYQQPRNSIVDAMVIVAQRILAVDERRYAVAYA